MTSYHRTLGVVPLAAIGGAVTAAVGPVAAAAGGGLAAGLAYGLMKDDFRVGDAYSPALKKVMAV